MGLDGVEILLTLEDHFGIEITNPEAERIRTVRDILVLIEAKVQPVPSEGCVSMRAFHTLRRAFAEILAVPARSIHPQTSLASLVPLEGRQEILDRILIHAGHSERIRLAFPPWVLWVAFPAPLVATFLLGVGVGAGWIPTLVAAGLCSAAFAWGFLRLMTPHRTRFPRELQRVRDLVHWRVVTQGPALEPVTPPWTRELIRIHVRRILCEQLLIPDTFSDEASLVKDLGLQ